MSWIYIANCDRLSPSNGNGPLIAFNLNTLGRTEPGTSADRKLPWELTWTGKFALWTYQQKPRARTKGVDVGALGKLTDEKTQITPLPPTTVSTDTVAQALAKAKADAEKKVQTSVSKVITTMPGNKTFAIFGAAAAEVHDTSMTEDSVTAVLAGLSQKGHPISAQLKMSHWIQMSEDDLMTGQQWLFAAPVLSWEGAEITPVLETEPSRGTADERPVVTVVYKKDDAVLWYMRISAADLEAPSLSRTLIQGDHLTLLAGDYSNWRREFPHSVGALLDLNWPRLHSKAENLTEEAVKRICLTALRVAHDRADLGLRSPLWAYPVEQNEKWTPGHGSLAWEVLTFLAEDSRVPGVEDKVNKALELAEGKHAQYLNKLQNEAATEDGPQWERLLIKVLREQPGSGATKTETGEVTVVRNAAGKTVSPYADLENVLEALITKTHPLTVTEDILQKVGEQLELLLTDERALVTLFCRQWDELIKLIETNEEGKVLFKTLLGSYEGNPMTQHREKIIAWAEAESKSLSVCYGQGLAGSLLQTHGSKLKNPRSVPDESASEQAEKRDAERVLCALLAHYREDRLKGNMEKDVFGFLPLPGSPGSDALVLAPDARKPEWDEPATETMIQQFVLWRKSTNAEADAARLKAKVLKSRPWAAVLAGSDRQGEPIAKPAALMVPTPVPELTRHAKPEAAPAPVPVPAPGEGAEAGAGATPVPGAADITEEFDPNQVSGWLLFGRRTESSDAPKDDDTDWHLLNVGDVVLKGEREPILPKASWNTQDGLWDDVEATNAVAPLAGHHVVPVPLGLTQRPLLDLPGSGEVVEYRGRPLGVLLWEDYATWDKKADGEEVTVENVQPDGSRTASAAGRKVEDALRHRQIISMDPVYRGWGAIPGLRYDRKSRYQFVFCAVHATGALPPSLRDPGSPAMLMPQKKVSAQIKDALEKAPGTVIEIKDYLRRVPVGQPRLTSAISDKGKYTPFRMTELSLNKVVPMATDLRLALEKKYLESLNTNQLEHLPQPPAQTLLLRDGSQNSFFIRPPTTDIDNWSIWQATHLTRMGDWAWDFISDVERLNRELKSEIISKEYRGGEEAALKELRETVANLADDPAVCGVVSRRRQIFPQLKTEYGEFKYYEFKSLEDGGAPDPGTEAEASLATPYSTETRERLLKALRKGWLNDEQSKCTLNWEAPPGKGYPVVYEYEFIPCVAQDDWQYFGLNPDSAKSLNLKEAKEEVALAKLDKKPFQEAHEKAKKNRPLGTPEPPEPAMPQKPVYTVFSGVLRLWVEHVPKAASINELLPSSESVWQSLKMGRIGEFSCKSPWVERLEVALNPSENKNIEDAYLAWTLVSTVELTFQKWYWRGLPEHAAEEMAVLLDPTLDKTGSPPDQRWEVVKKLRKGELPSFGDRRLSDSARHSMTVNFAAWYVHRNAVPKPPTVQLHAEPGEPLDVAEHVLGRLRVWNRYAGLPGYETGFKDGKTPLVDQNGAPAQDSKADANQLGEYNRRLTLKGTLKERLPVPRVKMVVPMMDPIAEKPDDQDSSQPEPARPGFLAITSETLRSPFHCLIAEVEWARLETLGDDGNLQVYTIPEIGQDPITSPMGQDWSGRDLTQARLRSELKGMACGLTYERQADSPRYPHAGYLFQAPKELMTETGGGIDRKDDWFVKVQFRQKIQPEHTMENRSWGLTSEPTGAWQVRLLAPMRSQDLWVDQKQKKELTLEDAGKVRCRFQDKDPASPLVFFIPESSGNGRNVQPKFQFTSGSVGDGVRDPRTAYLCTVWSLVPDALQAEASKAVHSLYLCYQRDQDTKYIQITRALQVDPKPGEGSKLEPAGMNLLRIFTMKGNLDGLIKSLLFGAEKNDFEKKLNIFIQWLYPDSHAGVVKNKDRIWSDAGGIPVRYSETIRFK